MQVQLDFTQKAGMPRCAGGFVPGIQASLWEVSCTGEAGLQVCTRGQSHVYVLRCEDSNVSGLVPLGGRATEQNLKTSGPGTAGTVLPGAPQSEGQGQCTFSRRITLVAHQNQLGSI